MADRTDLRLLLGGQYAVIEFDRQRNGQFESLNVLVPLQVILYFSATAKSQRNDLGGLLQAQPIDNHVPNPWPIRLVGGTAQGHRDVLDWMVACCVNNGIFGFDNLKAWPVRHILALTSIRVMGVVILEREILHTVLRLRQELLRADQVEQIFANLPDGALWEICAAIAVNVAHKFCAQKLPDVEKHYEIAKKDLLYDQAVSSALQELKKDNTIRGAWQACAAWSNRSLIQYQAMRTHFEPGYSFNAPLPYRPMMSPNFVQAPRTSEAFGAPGPNTPRFTAFYTRPSFFPPSTATARDQLVDTRQAPSGAAMPATQTDRAPDENGPVQAPGCPVCDNLSPSTPFAAHEQQSLHRMFSVRGHDCAPRRMD